MSHDDDGYDYDPPTREDDKAAELRMDAAEDAANAAREAADMDAEDQAADDDYDECQAQFVDGSWTYCGCAECVERRVQDEGYDPLEDPEYVR